MSKHHFEREHVAQTKAKTYIQIIIKYMQKHRQQFRKNRMKNSYIAVKIRIERHFLNVGVNLAQLSMHAFAAQAKGRANN